MVTADGDPLVTIVIPIRHDTDALAALLPTLPADDPSVEVVIVDGADRPDRGLDACRVRYPAMKWTQSDPGRARQMNAGAVDAHGRWLLFLHADTRLGPGWLGQLRELDARPSAVGGSFRFVLDSAAWWARWIERGVRLRVRRSASATTSDSGPRYCAIRSQPSKAQCD